jgi:hypothetical protein
MRRARQHQAVGERDRHAGLALGQRLEHARGLGAVDVEVLALAPVDRGDGVYRAVELEGNGADHRRVDDRVDGVGVVVGAIGHAAHAGARGGGAVVRVMTAGAPVRFDGPILGAHGTFP